MTCFHFFYLTTNQYDLEGEHLVNKSLYLLLLAMLTQISTPLFAGERIGDFALIDNQGTQHHMSWYDDQNAIVILPQAIGSTEIADISFLQQLRDSYAEQGVVFFLMNPGIDTDREAVTNDIASLSADFSGANG
jgi:hypothetical protein